MIARVLLSLLLFTSLQACQTKVFSDESWLAPKPWRMGWVADDAPELYKKGWVDGCKTGLSTMNQSYYKGFYQYTQDPDLANQSMYYKAWKDAYTYCRQYSFRYTWDAFDRRRGSGPLSSGVLCVLCPNEIR